MSDFLQQHRLQHTGFPVHHLSRSLLKLISIGWVMPSNHLILCHPLFLPPSIFPRFRVFSNKSVLCIRWPKYWSFSFSIIPSKEVPGLTSFRMDWLDLLAVQGTLKSLLQHHSSKASILLRSAFFRNANQNYNEISSHSGQNESTDNKCWRGCGENGTLLHS